jgi:predicted acetyltransferase
MATRWSGGRTLGQNDGVPELIRPDVRVRVSFLSARQEAVAEGMTAEAATMGSDDAGLHRADRFAAYVESVRAEGLEETSRPARFVPQTTYWWVDGEDYLGRISVRHRLTDFLLEEGGHIGYYVVPSCRRRGHATAMLRAVLPRAGSLGVDPALVTCDDTNLASRKVIEAAGGVLEDQRGVKLRYWVPTSSPTVTSP